SQEAPFRVVMLLDRAVGKNVLDGHVALTQAAGDKEEAMAVERLALGAHERDPMAPRSLFDSVETRPEDIGGGDTVEFDPALAKEGGVVALAAEFGAEEDIGDAGFAKRPLEGGAAELRPAPRIGDRAHVGDGGGAGAAQQVDERCQRMVRVADREDGGLVRPGGYATPATHPARTAAFSTVPHRPHP